MESDSRPMHLLTHFERFAYRSDCTHQAQLDTKEYSYNNSLNHMRIITCGGSHGFKDILKALKSYRHSVFKNIVLDGSEASCQDRLESILGDYNNYQYFHMPGVTFAGRIARLPSLNLTANYVTLSAVDDLIPDEAIIEILDSHSHSALKTNSKIIIGCGPDATYSTNAYTNKSFIWLMPKTYVRYHSTIDFFTYWDKIKHALSRRTGHERLSMLISDIGFLPFVYATYDIASLSALASAHLMAINEAGISKNSAKSGVLFEFLITAVSVCASPVFISSSLYKVGNYQPGSEGSNSDFNHRTILEFANDHAQIFAYFEIASACINLDIHIKISPYLLMSMYLGLAAVSAGLLSLSTNLANLKAFSSSYQHDEKLKALSTIKWHSTLTMLREAISAPTYSPKFK